MDHLNPDNYEDLETMLIAVGLFLLADKKRNFTDVNDVFSSALSVRIQETLAKKHGKLH
tara:strand:+ start:703 stop:879 length:177 start_codon:yes stop_codon:yes gene_type:complete